jgi:paraquat-inducible protein B
MTDDEGAEDALPQPEIRRRRFRVSPIWAIPLVALLIGLWLAYRTLSQIGPEITITFRTGEGLDAGKTRLKHNNVELGIVDKVELSADLSNVIVTATLNKFAAARVTENTRFWVVRPRISLSSLSGLETLLADKYIEVDAGNGKPGAVTLEQSLWCRATGWCGAVRAFTGLEEPPVVRADVPGREFILTTDRLGSIGPNTPIYYHSVRVGEVLGYEFAPNGSDIRIHAFVHKPYDRQVFPRSRFWNESGITVSAGTQGFKFEVESIQAVLAGGIGFDSPNIIRTGEPAKSEAEFPLYPSHDSALEASYVQRVPFVVSFDGSVRGLEVGAPVEFRGIKVGNVRDIRLAFDRDLSRVRIPVTVDFEPQRVQRSGLSPDAQSDPTNIMTVMNTLVARGMRAQLRTASLLTGQLVVAFDFFPNAPPAKITMENGIAVLPSVPSDVESLTLTASDLLSRMTALLDRVNKMPIEQALDETRQVMQSVRTLTDAPEIRASVKTLDKTLQDADHLLDRLDTLLASAAQAYGGESEVRREIVDLLREMQETARSVRVLTNYVEQHPEAFIRGKGAQ